MSRQSRSGSGGSYSPAEFRRSHSATRDASRVKTNEEDEDEDESRSSDASDDAKLRSRRSQVRTHSRSTPEEQEQDENNDDDDNEEEDPYNRRYQHHTGGHMLYDVVDESADPGGQVVYDSMSTILEVDSEDSEQSSSAQHLRSAELRRLLSSPPELSVSSRSASASGARGDDRQETGASSRPSSSQAVEARTSQDPAARSSSSASVVSASDSLAGRVSPVEQDRFRGTLSALAEQVERLRRSSTASPQNTIVAREQQQVAAEATGERVARAELREPASRESATSPMQMGGGSGGDLRQKSRANSAESLMMITVSPLGSPRVKFPLIRQRKQQRYVRNSDDDDTGNDEDDDDAFAAAMRVRDQNQDSDDAERRLVEVSNKSTVTAIDMSLMEKMAQKYFVETSDKASQSVKFDCEDAELDSTTLRLIQPTSGSGNQQARRTKCRSVAVGTEKFSRERFSLLPPTATRSTQTKANMMDQDLGTSETRRFKLSHQQFKPTTSRTAARKLVETIDTAQQQSHHENSRRDSSLASPEAKKPPAEQMAKIDRRKAASSPRGSSKSAVETDSLLVADKSTGDDSLNGSSSRSTPIVAATPMITATDTTTATNSSDESTSGGSYLAAPGPSNTPLASGGNNKQSAWKQEHETKKDTSDRARDLVATRRNLDVDKPQPVTITDSWNNGGQASNQLGGGGLIPSVKTELRVTIEFKDAKQRQQSELISDTQLIDGKLSKKTQVNTSKQVAASPREVLQKLQTAGRQHSLLYQDPRTLSQSANALTAATRNGADDEWRQVSQSCVRNEIETDTRRRPADESSSRQQARNANRSGTVVDGALVMSSDATIKHAANDTSAIELRSRAARQFDRFERDPSTGMLVRAETGERTLVESEAAFDENEPGQRSSRQSRDAGQVVSNPSVALPAREKDSGQRVRISESAKKDADLKSGQQQPALHVRPPRVAEKPTPPPKPQRQAQTAAETSSSAGVRGKADQAGGQRPVLTRQARLEIEEEREDRRQVSKNGRLVFDDRLRERRFETQRSTSASPLSPTYSSARQSPRAQAAASGHQRATTTTTLLKPISLSAAAAAGDRRSTLFHVPTSADIDAPATSPPILFADQTSSLSSDPETMDSGFAQSGAGSSSALNQQQYQQSRLQRLAVERVASAPSSPGAAPAASPSQQPRPARGQLANKLAASGSRRRAVASPQPSEHYLRHLQHEPGAQLDESLNFVDDDAADELIEQLDTCSRTRPPPAPASSSSSRPAPGAATLRTPHAGVPRRGEVELPANTSEFSERQRVTTTTSATGSGYLISPPPAFCAAVTSSSAAPQLDASCKRPRVAAVAQQTMGPTDTELSTRLTRCRRRSTGGGSEKPAAGAASKRGTSTRLEQSVVANHCSSGGVGGKQTAHTPSGHFKPPDGCRFNAQVMFESDTDSLSTERHSAASSRSFRGQAAGSGDASRRAPRSARPQKELISETKFTRCHQDADATNRPEKSDSRADESAAKWDYSLRVNRMRGNQVDSKVNTYIKHSRQPQLINPEVVS